MGQVPVLAFGGLLGPALGAEERGGWAGVRGEGWGSGRTGRAPRRGAGTRSRGSGSSGGALGGHSPAGLAGRPSAGLVPVVGVQAAVSLGHVLTQQLLALAGPELLVAKPLLGICGGGEGVRLDGQTDGQMGGPTRLRHTETPPPRYLQMGPAPSTGPARGQRSRPPPWGWDGRTDRRTDSRCTDASPESE